MRVFPRIISHLSTNSTRYRLRLHSQWYPYGGYSKHKFARIPVTFILMQVCITSSIFTRMGCFCMDLVSRWPLWV